MFYKQQQQKIKFWYFCLQNIIINSIFDFLIRFFFIIICDMYQQFLSKNGIQVNVTPLFIHLSIIVILFIWLIILY